MKVLLCLRQFGLSFVTSHLSSLSDALANSMPLRAVEGVEGVSTCSLVVQFEGGANVLAKVQGKRGSCIPWVEHNLEQTFGRAVTLGPLRSRCQDKLRVQGFSQRKCLCGKKKKKKQEGSQGW